MKKILAILLVLVMTVGLVPAVFADETTYTITINNTNAGHTYEAYQIFKGDLNDKGVLSNIEWGTGVDTTKIGNAYADIFTALGATANDDGTYSISGKDGKFAATAAGVAEALAASGKAAEFSKVIANYISDAKAVSKENKTTTGEGDNAVSTTTNYTIENLAAGYYFVKDQNNSLNEKDDAYTDYILKVVKSTSVDPKTGVPEIEKKVWDVNDTEGTAANTDNDNKWSDSADHDIGDIVKYKITIKLPENLSAYEKYQLVVTDTMSKGLTYKETTSVTYKKNSAEYVGIVIEAQTVSNATLEGEYTEGSQYTWTINLENVSFTDSVKWNELTEVVIEYTCELNENAKIGSAGNPNKIDLIYSNNPNNTSDTGKTPEDKVIVFTYQFDVSKVDGDNQPFSGAEFDLYKQVTKDEAVSSTADDGTETLNDKYSKTDDGKYWKLVKHIVPVEVKDGETVTAYTDTVKGIDDGTYKLVETLTPAGYNTAEDIVFTITAKHSATADNPILIELKSGNDQVVVDGLKNGYTYAEKTAESTDGILATSVVNKSGSTLPETGGIGTTIFYVLGGLLAVGAAILLITKKRMTVED